MPRDVGVIVVAAGQGTRLGGDVPKPFRTVAGMPVLLRALRPFAAHPATAKIAVVLRPADAEAPPAWLADLVAGGDMIQLTAGGDERMDSVAAGLAALPAVCTTIVVHDGARPFPAPETIDAVIARARHGEGAVAGVPLTDTLKRVTDPETHRIVETIPRAELWRAQTPQAFPRDMLERAHQHARVAGISATDDAALVERLGERVVVVPDSPRNVKITTPDDLALAECLARPRG